MMKYIISIVYLLSMVKPALAQTSAHLEESLYLDYQTSILSNQENKTTLEGFSDFEQSLYVDALTDLVEENNTEALKQLERLLPFHYNLVEKLRIEILKLKKNKSSKLSKSLAKQVINALKKPEVDIKLIYIIAANEAILLGKGHNQIVRLARNHTGYADIINQGKIFTSLSKEIISDLLLYTPDTTDFMGGDYTNSVKLFMLCRKNRLYPCLMVLKNVHGDLVRKADGTIWSHKALASAHTGLPSYERNGDTPAGVYTIDSVMPVADQQLVYGKNRRMILNFVPASSNERLLKSLLPASSLNLNWWQPSVVARNIGRNLLRIHGTGRRNTDPNSSYFPFMRTSGCIAQRENTYSGIVYNDQRILLDEIMTALNLAPVFVNETRIKGFLYLLEIDDKNRPVLLSDLTQRGIE